MKKNKVKRGASLKKASSRMSYLELKKKLNYLNALLDHSPDIIVAGDCKGNVVEFNRGAEKLLGYKKEEVLGKPITNFYFDPRDREKIMQLVKEKGQVIDYETRLKTKSGEILPISTTLAYIRNEKGKIIGTIGIAKDITRRKKLEKELLKMAVTDGLTGLYDRGYFNRQIAHFVKKAHQHNQALALIMMDLDRFKEYNDSNGHLMGDKILHKVGRIILRTIKNRLDTCYRYGGDEFIIIVTSKKSIDSLELLAEELRTEIELALGPKITASIGVTRFQPHQTVTDLIKSADEALYQAKAKGGNCVQIK